MGQEEHRRIWPPNAYHVFTTRATGEQRIRWYDAARMHTMKPHMGLFLARAADHYARYLQRQMNRAMKGEGKP